MRERGTGSIFQKPGTRFWWIGYSFRGHNYQESSESTDRKVAVKLLRERLKKVTKPHFVDPAKERRWTVADMLREIQLHFGARAEAELSERAVSVQARRASVRVRPGGRHHG